MTPVLILLLAACLLACYFAACHNALKTLSKRRLGELLDERGKAHRLEPIVDQAPSLLLATGIARAVCALIIVLSTHDLVEQNGVTEPLPHYAISFAIAIALMSVFTVAVPVYWARYRREKLLVWSIPFLHLVRVVFAPFTFPLRIVDPVLRRLSGIDLEDDEDLAEQVLDAVERHDEEETFDETQRQMIEGVVELAETTVGEIMTPRTDVQGIPAGLTLAEVKAAALEAGHSRIPVYRENLDDIAGILYAKDLIRFLNDGHEFNLDDVVREPFVVPESKPVRDLLAEFRQKKVHLAVVLDEYGGTAGLVTIEDILEEIVGEIHDEYEDQPDDPTIDVAPNELSATMDARLHIDELNDALGLDLPEDEDYETVAGYVVSVLGHIPAPGESFEHDGVKVVIDEAEKTKVLRVTVEKVQAPEQSTVRQG